MSVTFSAQAEQFLRELLRPKRMGQILTQNG